MTVLKLAEQAPESDRKETSLQAPGFMLGTGTRGQPDWMWGHLPPALPYPSWHHPPLPPARLHPRVHSGWTGDKDAHSKQANTTHLLGVLSPFILRGLGVPVSGIRGGGAHLNKRD